MGLTPGRRREQLPGDLPQQRPPRRDPLHDQL